MFLAHLCLFKENDSLHFSYWVISLASWTSAASMTSVASMTSTASMTWTASFHQKTYWAWCFHQPWYQNDLFWSLNVGWIIKNLLFYWFLEFLQNWGCGGQGCYFWPNPRVISKKSAIQNSQITFKPKLACIFLPTRAKWSIKVCVGTPCIIY